jgi:hypothetical protein
MHMLEGRVNFSRFERPIKEIKGAGCSRVEMIQIKMPDRLTRSAKEIREEIEEDLSLLIMIGNNTSTMLQQMDFVTATTLSSGSMEKSCVFIPLDGSLNLASLPPVKKLFFNCTSENVSDDGSEGSFSPGEGAIFLNNIKELYNNLTVNFPLRAGAAMPVPFFGSRSGAF